ncbi:hypothetical protein HCN44_010412 [Aphidius gifuensis]|uniref:Uncharacterized protein n=1 Tax=Aphidius gifuensis TaxID=684658 RepID=A0A834XKW9_APHGI|nr:hypothetical protein HCN44_010412 [Aphidius gifuensis]
MFQIKNSKNSKISTKEDETCWLQQNEKKENDKKNNNKNIKRDGEDDDGYLIMKPLMMNKKPQTISFDGVSAVGKTTFLSHIKHLSNVSIIKNDYTDICRQKPIYKGKEEILESVFVMHLFFE